MQETNKIQLKLLRDEYLRHVDRLNFTAHRSPDRLWKFLIWDSVLPVELGFFDLSSAKKVLDIGTGGGFPAMPLACLYQKASFTLIDSVQKKLSMVDEVAKNLSYDHVSTVAGRFEELAHMQKYRERFDVVTAKAVAKWHTLLEYALPFVMVGGRFIAYQGPAILDEIEGSKPLIKLLGAEITAIHQYNLEGEPRVLVELQKVKPTSEAYPRAVGVPKKEPLLKN